MTKTTEIALLDLFKEKMAEITRANDKLRKWMYLLIGVFSIGLLSSFYWAGSINQKVESISANVNRITKQVDRIEAKYGDIVWFMIAEFKYEPVSRGFDSEED